MVLQLLEKDIQRYQIISSNPGFTEATDDVLGGFFRDEDQLLLEKRRSLRIDDTAQCLIAMAQMLETLESIRAVQVEGEL